MASRFFVCIFGWVLAFAASASPQSGVVAALTGNVSILRGTETIIARAATPIFLNDTVVTDVGARLQILLRDQSTFSVGENAEITIDEFVYQPKEKTGTVAASIGKGAFRFVSGKIAKKRPDNMKVKVGDVVVAVRGTEVIGNVQPDQSSIILLSGAIDVMSLSADCVANSGGAAAFEIGPDGELRMSGSPLANAPASCSQSVNLPGFGVSVSASGEVSQPLRIELDEVDGVLDELALDESTETEAEAEAEAEADQGTDRESEPSSSEDSNSDTSGSETSDGSQDSDLESSEGDLDAEGNVKPEAVSSSDASADDQIDSGSESSEASRSADLEGGQGDLDADGNLKPEAIARSDQAVSDSVALVDGEASEAEQVVERSFDELLKQELLGDGKPEAGRAKEVPTFDQSLKVEEQAASIGKDGKPLIPEEEDKSELQDSSEEVASQKAEDEVIESSSSPAAPTVSVTDISQVTEVTPSAGSGASLGSVKLNVSDPNPEDTVTLSVKDAQNATWISLTDLGSGQYALSTLAGVPSQPGSYTMTITGSDGSLSGTDTLILDVCSFDDCGDFLQNVDGVAPTATDDSGGFKVNGQTYTFISNSGALYQSLFGAGRPTGTFEKTWDASIASAYDRGGASSGSITGRIVVNFAAESASIVISGDLDNLSTGNNYNKGDLTFSDTHSIANIPAASSGGVLLIEETFDSQNSDEGGPFSYQYQIGLGDDGSGGLGVSGRVLIEDDPTYGSGTSINTEGPQILEPQ